MKTYIKILIASVLPLCTACVHKDLYFEEDAYSDVKVVFDWSQAPDANPSSMAVYLFDGVSAEPMRYIFVGREGGHARIPAGSYSALSMNSDNEDWAVLRNNNDIDNFEIMTSDAPVLRAYGLETASLPRTRGTENERIASTPGMLWGSREDSLLLPEGNYQKVLTLHPSEAVCHYTVTVKDVKNIGFVRGVEVDATLSGMSEGYMHGKQCSADNHVTMPFVLTADYDADILTSRFLTFGECSGDAQKHIITIYLYLSDDSKWYYTFDVTEQIANAPDPRHVDIVVSGLTLPQPVQSGGGLQPNVNDWQTTDIDLKM